MVSFTFLETSMVWDLVGRGECKINQGWLRDSEKLN